MIGGSSEGVEQVHGQSRVHARKGVGLPDGGDWEEKVKRSFQMNSASEDNF